MKIKRLFTQILAVALCLALLCPLCAFADGDDKSAIPADPDSYAVIDPAALQKMVEEYITTHHLNKEKISVGYCYLDTGDTWFYNGDHWYFAAGVYSVPLMMILAERESKGELTRESDIRGVSLGDSERLVLVDANNYYVHEAMHYIGKDRDVRMLYRNYSELPEEYYHSDFLDYSYFSARFLTDVMKTLYYDNDRFPNIMDCLKQHSVNSHFHGALGQEFDVAQKYGNYIDRRNVAYNNCVGVVYTPHPFVLVVMTEGMGISQEIMCDMSVLFKDYTLSLDAAYEAWKAKPTTPPVSIPGLTGQGGGNGEGQPGGQNPFLTDGETQPGQDNPGEEGAAVIPAKSDSGKTESPSGTRRMTVLLLSAAALVILMLAAVLRPILRKKKNRKPAKTGRH